MEKEVEKLINIKVALSLRQLLEKGKKNPLSGDVKQDVAKSYNRIAINANIRKATVSDTFNAKHSSYLGTIILIIEAMGFNLEDFSQIYCSINEDEISNFKDSFD